jgi:hypothetical protein
MSGTSVGLLSSIVDPQGGGQTTTPTACPISRKRNCSNPSISSSGDDGAAAICGEGVPPVSVDAKMEMDPYHRRRFSPSGMNGIIFFEKYSARPSR